MNYVKLFNFEGLTLYQDVIISYLKSYQLNDKYFFAGEVELSRITKIPLSTLKKELKELIERKLVFKSQDKKYIKATFNNRKAIILVDDENPFQVTNNNTQKSIENIKSEVVSIQNDSTIPTIEYDCLKSKEIENGKAPKPVIPAKYLDKMNY